MIDKTDLWAHFLAGSLDALDRAGGFGDYRHTTFNHRAVAALKCAMPYLLCHRVDDRWTWLHREYKHVGFSICGIGNQSLDLDMVGRDDIVELVASMRSPHPSEDTHWLYNDGTAPWHSKKNAIAYREKLSRIVQASGVQTDDMKPYP